MHKLSQLLLRTYSFLKKKTLKLANLNILYIYGFFFFFFCIIHNFLKLDFIPLASRKSIKLFCKALPPNILTECLLLLSHYSRGGCSRHDNVTLLPAKLFTTLIKKKKKIQLFKVNTVILIRIMRILWVVKMIYL